MDANKDGSVSREELSAWIKRLHHKDIQKDIERTWSDHDLVKGNLLTWEKYIESLFGEDGEYEGEYDRWMNGFALWMQSFAKDNNLALLRVVIQDAHSLQIILILLRSRAYPLSVFNSGSYVNR